MATAFVYRRPFDYRRPQPQWLLLRPDLDIAATAAALTLAGQQATAVIGRSITATAPALALNGQHAAVNATKVVSATAASLILTGRTAAVSVSTPDPLFIYRELPMLVPMPRAGVYRAGFTVRRVRVPAFFPALISSGNLDIAASRGTLTLSGVPAAVQFDEALRLWALQEALRTALLRRRIGFREIRDTSPWDQRIVQFTIPTSNLTAYAGVLTLTGQQSTLLLSRNIVAQAAALAIGRPAAAVRLAKQIAATAASLTLAGQNARVATGRTITGVHAALTLAGQTSDTDLDKAIVAGAASLTLAGISASFGNNRNVAGNVAVLVITPRVATPRIEKAVAALAAALSLHAQTANAALSGSLAAHAATLTLSGHTGQVDIERIVHAAVAELSLDARQALIEGSLAVIVQVGRRTVRVRARNSTITVH